MAQAGGTSLRRSRRFGTPSVPSVQLPGGGSTGGVTDGRCNGTVNDVVGGVNNTVNGLLGN